MRIETTMTAVSAVAVSWLAAAIAAGTALVLAVTGQGLGAVAGGCTWIGVTIPLDRQVWALVNQPVLNFSSLPSAAGYWLGSVALPMLAALLLFSLRPRKPALAGQLMVIQTMWWISLIAGVWLPLLDPGDGHLSRWLELHRLEPRLVWLAPLLATGVAVLASLRLLEIARRGRSDLGCGARVRVVIVHLVVPVAGWLYLVFSASGALALRPALGLAAPVTAVLAFAWLRYPPPYPRPLQTSLRRSVVALVVCALGVAGGLWVAGRPLAGDRTAAVVWGTPGSFNNIRPWVETSSPE
jgi:hypothetical protein